MAETKFQPGFRLSTVDCIVFVVGTIASFWLWPTAWWIGFIVVFVVAHFFLFCNVFRIARTLELIWSGIFVVLTYCTIMFGTPTWAITIAVSLLTTAVLVAIEMQKPSYHGILWQRINPRLREWWASQDSKS